MLLKRSQYLQINNEDYDRLMANYTLFIDALNDVKTEPVRVFEPLSQKILDELELIRDVSKDLQKKKEEDMKKTAHAVEVAEELPKKKEEEKEHVQKDE